MTLKGDNAKPWLLAGDFNVLAHPSKSNRFDGSQLPNRDIKEFTECLQELAVFDHAYEGPMFTWTNCQEEGFIARKLDRVFVNCAWLQRFPHSTVEFKSLGDSDHCLAYIRISQDVITPPKPFKFFNCWSKHADFLETVKNSWQASVEGSPMVILHKKLKRLKEDLRRFNSTHFAGISEKLKAKRNEIIWSW